MAKNKTVAHTTQCPTGKRSFYDEHDADKALGRARTKRIRGAGGGTRRGLEVESRYYECGMCGGYHLTHQSRRTFNGYAGTLAVA
jgi:hypothetical protein